MGKASKEAPSKQGINLSIMEVMNYVVYLSKEQVEQGIQRCKETGHLKRYCYILHDKDIKEDGTLKPPHYHVFIQFDIPYNTANVAQWFGITQNFIRKLATRYDNAALYCIHKHDLGKYQYDENEVVSNFDYHKLIEKDDKKKAKKDADARLFEIIQGIESGEIREFNYHNYISVAEYVSYKDRIEKAWQYRRDKIAKEDRHQDVIFITGLSGSGKTTFAKDYAKKLNYSFYVSSGSNDVLDSYQGQDVLILDDLRPSVMGLSDLLKMLDNNTNSTVKSRYHNKMLECKTIIITSILPIEQFFHNVFSEEEESIVQFKRRCKFYFKFDIEFYEMYIYDSKKRDYRFIDQKPNYIAEKFAPKELTEEDIDLEIARVFGDFIPKENYTTFVSEQKKEDEEKPGQFSPSDDNNNNNQLSLFEFFG